MRPLRSILFIWLLSLMLADTGDAQWVKKMTTAVWYDRVDCFAVIGTNLFAGSDGDSVYLSTDSGDSWTTVSAGLKDYGRDVRALAVIGTNLFAGTGGGVFLSTNRGASWKPVNTGLTYTYNGSSYICSVRSLAVNGTTIYAGTDAGNGVYLSTNNGGNWTAVNTGLPLPETYYWVNALAVSGTTVFAGTGYGVFHFINGGTSWTAGNAGLTSTTVYALAMIGTDFYAGTDSSVFISYNNGASWFPLNHGMGSRPVWAFAISGKDLFAGSDDGVFLLTEVTDTWVQVNSGLPQPTWVLSLAVSGGYLFAGNKNSEIWRRPLSEMPRTSVEGLSIDLPTHFSLAQNYPNPFNPSTTIRYALPHRSHVTMTVSNTLGQQVATLVNADIDAGSHEVKFDGSRLASGVYFYRLMAGSFVETRELALVR